MWCKIHLSIPTLPPCWHVWEWRRIGALLDPTMRCLRCSALQISASCTGGTAAVALLEGDYQRRIAVISVSGQPIPALCTVLHCVCCTLPTNNIVRYCVWSEPWSGCIAGLQNRYQAENITNITHICCYIAAPWSRCQSAKKDLSDKEKEMTRERRGECQWRAYDQHKYDQHNKREGEISFYIASPIYRILPTRSTNVNTFNSKITIHTISMKISWTNGNVEKIHIKYCERRWLFIACKHWEH